jgi:hypothetical protein
MSKLAKFYKIVTPKSAAADVRDNIDITGMGGGAYGNYTWYHRLVQGSPARLTRYREYDIMDNDVEVARALDIIAEEMTGNNPKSNLPLELHITDTNVPAHIVATLKAALNTWCKLQNWDKRLYGVARTTIKYGNCFFLRGKGNNKGKKWKYVNPKAVVAAVTSEDDITDVRGWHIKVDTKRINGLNQGYSLGYNSNANPGDYNVEQFPADDVITFALEDEFSEDAPFGKSVLSAVYRTFKQKELLEDSIIIYRIVRAPEKRVFYIDTGKMPPHQVATHLEQIKNEIKQKKIPTFQGGQSQVESVYNPQSMSEDFFFSKRADGSGSSVETLPGGQNLGELTDLNYFYSKLWRGLRIPASYMDSEKEGSYNDGKVGVAYIQEIKFSQYAERLQKDLEITLDKEFKRFLYETGISIDPTCYNILLPAPSNWSKSKQQDIDANLLNNFNTAVGNEFLSRRFVLERYLQLSKEEIATNERMRAEELGLPFEGGMNNLGKIYYPEVAEAGGFDGAASGGGGTSGGGGGGIPLGPDTELDDIEGEMGGDETDLGGEDTGEEAGGDNEAPDLEAPEKGLPQEKPPK